MKALFLTLLFTFTSFSQNQNWSVESSYTTPDDNGLSKSVINFKKGELSLNYIPSRYPWGMVETKRFRLNDKHYFLTIWPVGPKTFRYRVFLPEGLESGPITPLCEVYSFSEDPGMELKNGGVIVETTDYDVRSGTYKSIWRICE